MTTPLFNHGWEKRLHEELKKLPGLDAPDSLVPNVLGAIRARQEMAARAWWLRPATTWHPAARIALSVAALALFGLLILGGHLIAPSIAASSEMGFLAQMGAKIGVVLSALVTLLNALGVIVRDTLSPVLLAMIAGACFSYVALLGIGGALWRTVLNQVRD